MNKIYDILTPYGWIGLFAISIGIYQIISFGDMAIGMGSMMIIGGILIFFINFYYQTKWIEESQSSRSVGE